MPSSSRQSPCVPMLPSLLPTEPHRLSLPLLGPTAPHPCLASLRLNPLPQALLVPLLFCPGDQSPSQTCIKRNQQLTRRCSFLLLTNITILRTVTQRRDSRAKKTQGGVERRAWARLRAEKTIWRAVDGFTSRIWGNSTQVQEPSSMMKESGHKEFPQRTRA